MGNPAPQGWGGQGEGAAGHGDGQFPIILEGVRPEARLQGASRTPRGWGVDVTEAESWADRQRCDERERFGMDVLTRTASQQMK